MDRKKKVIISIISVILIIVVVAAATYAYIVAITNEEEATTGSGLLDINYTEPADITGVLSPSTDRSGGLFTSAKASLKTSSVVAILNMYITPTALDNLNIPALKWEAEGVRNGEVICSGSGDFSAATVGEPINLFENNITDNIDDCVLSTADTTFNIYIWLDADLINTALGGIRFGATIGADSVDITGIFEE